MQALEDNENIFDLTVLITTVATVSIWLFSAYIKA